MDLKWDRLVEGLPCYYTLHTCYVLLVLLTVSTYTILSTTNKQNIPYILLPLLTAPRRTLQQIFRQRMSYGHLW